MNLVVVTACFYPDDKPLWRLRRSCTHFGYQLRPYGVGQSFQSWRHAKLTALRESLQNEDADVVLYTDAADTWFLKPPHELLAAFERRDVPVLVSCETECYPNGKLADKFPTGGRWRYPNAGQFMGRYDHLVAALAELETKHGEVDDYNDQSLWLAAFASGTFPKEWLDTGCRVFQTTAGQSFEGKDAKLSMRDDEIVNNERFSTPCAVHFNGGGDKEERMAPIWGGMRWA